MSKAEPQRWTIVSDDDGEHYVIKVEELKKYDAAYFAKAEDPTAPEPLSVVSESYIIDRTLTFTDPLLED